jgi:hypothetical protein
MAPWRCVRNHAASKSVSGLNSSRWVHIIQTGGDEQPTTTQMRSCPPRHARGHRRPLAVHGDLCPRTIARS